jgi:hypothetical protein
MDEPGDPFATETLRGRVLDAWAASPARFREDANAEEDYALGGYRDRVVVELAQNAADAAARAGRPGRLRLTLRDRTLTAANTGAPLDAAGVEALSTLRASSKRDSAAPAEMVGRFGVGFAAVVAVSDEPRIYSAAGAVAWSRSRTRALLAAIPALADELGARSGDVPLLRLPFPHHPGDLPPEGFATAVELPLRDDAAVALVTRLLDETGPALLLALPALGEVVIETGAGTRVLAAARPDDDPTAGEAAGETVLITADGTVSRWQVAAAGGALDPELLADRPAEERARTTWSVRWAVPVDPADGTPVALTTWPPTTGQSVSANAPASSGGVVYAPTPTDEPLGLPALLIASFPLSPDRRHIAPGPLTDFLIERAAEAYAGMLPGPAPGPGLLSLVPGPVGRGEIDARLSRAIVSRLPDVAFLPAVAEAGARVRPRDALLLGGGGPGLAEWLAPVLPNLVAGPPRHPAFAVLGVRRLPLAELADLLAPLSREPSWWHGLYAALADASPPELAELGALPVPLADGRLVRGARGVLLPGPGLDHPDRLAVLGLRVAAPEAAHPLLARLGAAEATPRGVLDDPATRAAVAASYESAIEAGYDDDGPERLAEAVLGLVAALGAEPGEYPWLGDLALPGDDGDWYPAAELLLPGSPLAEVIAADAPFGTIEKPALDRYGTRALEAAGVLSSFGLLTAEDIDLDESGIDLDLDGAAEWAADTQARFPADGIPPVALDLVAVRDLDLVDPDRWPRALELLARPPLRAALAEPTRIRLGDGRHADVPSYTAWWLRRHLTLGGRRPTDLRAPDSDPLLAGLYDRADGAIGDGVADAALARILADPVIARALGVRRSLEELLAEPGGPDELMERLADPARPVSRSQLRSLWTALALTEAVSADALTAPERVRAVLGSEVIVADPADVLILDAPDLWPLLADQPLVLAPHPLAARLAELLDLPLASEEIAAGVGSPGERRPVPDAVFAVVPAAPVTYQAHDAIDIDGVEIGWRYLDGRLHAASAAGLARGLAWAGGRWPDRHLLTALLTSPGEAPRALAEADLDD